MAVRKTPRAAAPAPAVTVIPARPAPSLPAVLVPLVYAVVTLLLFREFLFGGVSMLGQDTIGLSYFARNFYTEFVQQYHRMPYWNPYLFGGIPFVEGMHGDIFYPPSLAMFFMDARTMWGWKMALHIFLAGVFMFLWLRRGLGLDRMPAFIGGLLFMLGADLVSLIFPGGDGKLFASALTPLMFWLTERAVRGRRAADFAVFSLGLALILFTSHMQAAYYCVWGVSLYFFFRVWQVWRAERDGRGALRLSGMFVAAGLLGVGAAAVQFLPPLEYLREFSFRVDRAAERGYTWSSSYSLNAEEVMGLVVPEFPGRVPLEYWGKNGIKHNHEYIGLLPLLLIPVLLLRRRTAQVGFFAVLAALALLYAMASSTPAGRLFYLIPGVTLFRAWSIIIFVFAFAMITLAAIALQQMQDWLTAEHTQGDRVPAGRTLWVVSGVLLLLAVFAQSGMLLTTWVSLFWAAIPQAEAQALTSSESYIIRGFWITFGISVLVAATWHAARKRWFSPAVLLLALALIGTLDLYRVDRRFLQVTSLMNRNVAPTQVFYTDDIIRQLQAFQDAGGIFRVFDIGKLPTLNQPTYQANDLAIHGIEQMTGHHGNEIGRYAKLVGGDDGRMFDEALRMPSLTNTEYLVAPVYVDHPALEVVYENDATVLYRNREALPRAYFAGRVEVLDGDSAMAYMVSESFDMRNAVILPAPLPADVDVQEGSAGSVEWVERTVDGATLRVSRDRPGMLVVLDNWFPAWKATVDGRATPIYRANHTFRAIAVPAGEHTVEFRYEAQFLRTGAIISLLVLAGLLAVILGSAVRERRALRRQREHPGTVPVGA